MNKLEGKTLPKLGAQTPDKIPVVVNPSPDLEIGADLDAEMGQQPGLFAYYGILAEEAKARAKKVKFRIHCLREDLDARIRAKGEIRTEKAIEAAINRSPKMRALFKLSMDRQREAGFLAVLAKAFDQRKDMLQSMGANRRKEMAQGEMQTLQQKAREKLKHRKQQDEE